MAFFGAVGEYVEGEEDWSQYVERLGHFFGANGVNDARPKAYQTLASLVAPETPGGKTYDELIKLMAEHLSPKPPVIVQRYRFHSRVRQQGEFVSVYVTQLKELARKSLKISQGCEVAERGEQVLELEPRGVTGVCGGTTLLISAHIEVLSVLGVAKEVISGGRVNKYKRRLGECSHLGEEYRCCEESEDLEEEGDSTNALQQLRIQGVLCKINNEPIQLQVSIDGVLVTMELDTGAAVSIVSESTFRRLCSTRPYAIKEKIEKELNKLVQEGILQPVELSEWAAPIVPVVKPDQSIRICGDFRLTVNQALETEWYPLPKNEDILASLAEDNGQLLQGIPKVIVYIDDILITGSTDKEHLETLEKVLYKLKEAGIHLNKDKCFFLQESVVYLGYKIDKNGIHPLAEKVEAVKNAPEPKNITELKSYLGLLTYYSRFLPRMATMLAQLYRLLQAKIPWNWTQKEKMAFENSKNLLLSAKVLVHFDPNKELILACDASSYGVGAVLSHKMSDGTDRPIAFASRTLSSAEKNYSQLEKEGLACIFGVKRFHLYLYGRNFTIVTDHKPLLQLFDPQRGIPMQVSGRIQRWIMTLAVYKYKLVFKETEEHGNADALSRLPMDRKQIEEEEEIPTELVLLFESLKDSPVDCSQVKHWTKKDPIMSQVLQYILAGWPLHPPSGASQTLLSFWQRRMELSTHDGCILWGNRVVVPEKGRNYVLQELHGGHPGISRMKSLSRTFVWWPGIDKDIEMLVSKCPQCQAARPSPPVAPLQPWSWPTRPWARLHIDYAGPVEGQMLLVVIDAHSKWIEVEVGKDATAEATIQRLRTIFSRLSTDVAAEDPELNNGAQDEQEEDANNSVVGDEPEIDEEIDQEARPPVIVQQAPDRRYPSRNRRLPERYQAGFS
eukprot:Em0006g1272a